MGISKFKIEKRKVHRYNRYNKIQDICSFGSRYLYFWFDTRYIPVPLILQFVAEKQSEKVAFLNRLVYPNIEDVSIRICLPRMTLLNIIIKLGFLIMLAFDELVRFAT